MTLKQRIEKNKIAKKTISVFAFIVFKSIRLIRKRKKNNSNITLIISLHNIGDTVFTIPAIRLYLKHSNDKTIIICYKDSETIYRKILDNVDYFILSNDDFYLNGRLSSGAARNKVNKLSADTIIDMKGSVVSASLIFSSHCNRIVGVNEEYFKGIYDSFLPVRTAPHQIDIYFDAVKSLIPDYELNFNGYPVSFNNLGSILIQPFSGWKAKEWGLNNFVLLYKKLAQSDECTIIFSKSKISQDNLETLKNDKIETLESNSIENLIEEILKCKLFISNDSGPLQIAALFGKPTFSIYGPTNPEYHLPIGKHHKFIYKNLRCSPKKEKYCYTDGGLYCPHYDCLKLLSVDEVYIEVKKMLSLIEDSNE